MREISTRRARQAPGRRRGDERRAQCSTRQAWAAAAGAAAVALALCVPAIGLPFGWDESVTVSRFVTAPTVVEAATRQAVFNNHLALSVMDHLVWAASGTASEPAMRLVPTAALVAATGLLAWVIARAHGAVAGLIAGLLLCTNPVTFAVAREARGYGLMVLSTIGSTVLLRKERWRPTTPAGQLAYLGIAAFGVAAQTYMLFTLALQVAWSVSIPDLRRRRVYLQPILAGTIGLAVQIPLLLQGLDAGRGRTFRPAFPADVATAILGGTVPAVVALLALGAPVAVRALRQPAVRATVALGAAVIAGAWVVAPTDLYPRFFVALVPGVAAVAGVGVQRLLHAGRAQASAAVALMVVALTANTAAMLPTLRTPPLGNRAVARIVDRIDQAGATPCVLVGSYEPMEAYRRMEIVRSAADLRGCDVVVSVAPEMDEPAIGWLQDSMETVVEVQGAQERARIFTSAPAECVTGPVDRCWSDAAPGAASN